MSLKPQQKPNKKREVHIQEIQGDRKVPTGLKFLFGGTAGCLAVLFVQPLDLLKNRLQVSKEKTSMVTTFLKVIREEGFLELYNGLSAGLLRQATYTTTRLGVYTTLFDMLSSPEGTPPGYLAKTGIAMLSGISGAFVGTPADLALVRMTADGKLPPSERRNYKSVVDALARIYKEEGFTKLWRGAVPTMVRAMVLNAAQLATYSQSKQVIVERFQVKEGVMLHFLSSLVSGVVTAVASTPVDVLKTRIQNMKVIDGKPEYKGPLDVFFKVVKNEGVFALWKGLLPFYIRLAPQTVLIFIFLEQLNAAYLRFANRSYGA